MKIEELEKALRKAKNSHLRDDVLVSYRDQELDKISREQAWAHLDHCMICDRRLLLLQKEREAIDAPGEVTAEELDSIKRAARQTMSEAANTAAGSALTDRMAEYLRQAAASWQRHFTQPTTVPGAEPGGELWRWESDDGTLTAYAVPERNADLTITISSGELSLENARLKVRLGLLTQETVLSRVSESEVRAEVKIPRRQWRGKLADFSIEMA